MHRNSSNGFDCIYFYQIICIHVRIILPKFNKKVSLHREEQDIIKTYLIPKKLRKKQYLLQEGDVCKSIAFVEKGALREYSLDENGNEHIIQFALEGWTISDLYSFLTGEPATYNIDALEDAELVLISKSAHEELLQKVPKYETYTRLQYNRCLYSHAKKINLNYQFAFRRTLRKLYCTLSKYCTTCPQHMIASYMGLQPETLSRIRRKISTNK